MLPARVSARRKRRSASRKRTEPPSDEISPPPEIGGHLLASDGWEIEPEQAIVGHGGVALSLHGKKDASTTNFHPITTTYATSATTSLDPARIKRVSCRALRGLEEDPSARIHDVLPQPGRTEPKSPCRSTHSIALSVQRNQTQSGSANQPGNGRSHHRGAMHQSPVLALHTVRKADFCACFPCLLVDICLPLGLVAHLDLSRHQQ